MAALKIAILGIRGFPKVQGGVENHCEQLSAHLVKIGCDVAVFVRRFYADRRLRSYRGVRLFSLPTVRISSLETIPHTFLGVCVNVIKRPEVLHLPGIGPAIFTPFARLFGLKVVVSTHGSKYEHMKWNWFAIRFLKLLGPPGSDFLTV